MAENSMITVGGKPGPTNQSRNSKAKVIGLKLDIIGKELNFRIAVGQGQATLADIVPLARIVCDKVTDVIVESIHSDGAGIPCREGCDTCCSRCLFPLSIPEALRLNEEISENPPTWREQILQKSLLAARRILSQKPPETFIDQTEDTSLVGREELNLVSDWYASLELSCPFLQNGQCTIYDQRPLACREHFVKGSASACRGQSDNAEVLDIPLQMPNALAQLAGELEGAEPEAVMLPLALVWFEQNQQRAHRAWPAVMMVNRFLEIVKDMASKNSEAVVA